MKENVSAKKGIMMMVFLKIVKNAMKLAKLVFLALIAWNVISMIILLLYHYVHANLLVQINNILNV